METPMSKLEAAIDAKADEMVQTKMRDCTAVIQKALLTIMGPQEMSKTMTEICKLLNPARPGLKQDMVDQIVQDLLKPDKGFIFGSDKPDLSTYVKKQDDGLHPKAGTIQTAVAKTPGEIYQNASECAETRETGPLP